MRVKMENNTYVIGNDHGRPFTEIAGKRYYFKSKKKSDILQELFLRIHHLTVDTIYDQDTTMIEKYHKLGRIT